MKTRSIALQISMGLSLALLSFGIANARAAAIPLPNAGYNEMPRYQEMGWEHTKVEKLQHAYRLLEHADGDYAGHKALAMKSLKRASEILGVEIHGAPHVEENQWTSDRQLREAKHLLEDLAVETGGGEEQAHLHKALKEIDRALAVK